MCLGLGDLQRSHPFFLPSFSLGVQARGLSRQSSLFGILSLFLRQCGQSSLFACSYCLLLPACGFGNISLALLLSCNSGMFRGLPLRLCRGCLILCLHGGQPVEHADLLMVEKRQCLAQQPGFVGGPQRFTP